MFEKNPHNDLDIKEEPQNKSKFPAEKCQGPCYAKKEILKTSDGKEIEFLGVRHTPETLAQFRDEIEEYIKNSDVLLSELFVAGDEQSEDDIKVFYKAITQMAQKSKKEMVIADPEKEFSDAVVNRAVSIMPMLASFGAGIYLGKKLMDLTHELEMRRMYKKYYPEENFTKNDEQLISRRSFLKGALATGIMATGGLSAIAGLLEEMKISKEKGELLENFLLDSLDYRNALISREIIELSKNDKKVSVIYGAAHLPGVTKFLEDPELLDRKIKVYQNTYGIFNKATTDVYDFRDNK